MINESRFRQVLQLEGVQWYLEAKDQYSAYTTNTAIVEETKTQFLNDLFQKAMETGSYKDFSALYLRDLTVGTFKELQSKVKNTIRKLMDKVLKRVPNTKESLIEKLENTSKAVFETVLKARVPRYKLDQVLAYLQKRAKKENKELPQFIVNAFLKNSILGPSIESKLVENSFMKNIKEAIDTIIKNWESANDEDKEHAVERFEGLLGDVFKYTDFEEGCLTKRGEVSETLKEFILKIRTYVSHKNEENTENLSNFQNILRPLMSENPTRVTKKRAIISAKINVLFSHRWITRDLLLDKEEYLSLLREEGEILSKIPYERHDREMVLTAIKNSAWAILFAEADFCNNREMIAEALRNCKRLFIIPLFRTFISRGNRSTFSSDVDSVQFLHVEKIAKIMKHFFSSITFNHIKRFLNQIAQHLSLMGNLIKTDSINAIKALLRIPQNMYVAITNMTRQDIEYFLAGVLLSVINVSSAVLDTFKRIFKKIVEKLKNIPNNVQYFLRLVKEVLQEFPQAMRRIFFLVVRGFMNAFNLNHDVTRVAATLGLFVVAFVSLVVNAGHAGLKLKL